MNLYWHSQTFGVDLDFKSEQSLWRVEAQSGSSLVKGQAVALRVWGGGWVRPGSQTFSIGLQLSDTPSYEWQVLGATLGEPLNSGTFALWNSVKQDYMVFEFQTVGLNLAWFKNTDAGHGTPPPPAARRPASHSPSPRSRGTTTSS
jgi:hypothetical protein